MSGNAYDNPWKDMIMRSKKAFKCSTHSQTHQHQSQITKNVLKSWKYLKSIKKSKEFENNEKILGDIIKNGEMGIAFH